MTITIKSIVQRGAWKLGFRVRRFAWSIWSYMADFEASNAKDVVEF